MSFRLSARYLFLTYPQVGETDVALLEQKLVSKGAAKYCIGIELHEDGGLHYHALVDMGKKINWESPRCLDIGDLHGDYKAAIHPDKVLEYVTKDGNYRFMGWTNLEEAKLDVSKVGKKRSSDWEEIGAMIQSGATTKDIVTSKKQRWKDLSRIDDAVSQWGLWNMPTKDPFQGVTVLDANPETTAIGTWLNTNVQKPRLFKQKQLYLYGDKNLGKTSLINLLSEHLNIFYAPNDSEWMDEYSDDYDLIVFDEFRAQYTIQWLNRFLEGSVMPLKRRAKSPALKKKNVPVIILSNFSLQEAYQKSSAEKLETLEARLLTVHIHQFLKIAIATSNGAIDSEEPLPMPNGLSLDNDAMSPRLTPCSGETPTSKHGTQVIQLE